MSKEEIYAELGKIYRWTPCEIAMMTPYQQHAMVNPRAVAKTLYFATMEDFLEWRSRRGA